MRGVPRRLLLAWAFGLFALGAAYQIKGNVELVAGDAASAAIDLRNRDYEQAFFMEGKDPYDHMVGSEPPWGYVFGQVLVWPPWPAVRGYFAAINLIALAWLMIWAYREPRGATVEARLLIMAAVFAFGGSCTATEVGQISIVVTALLAGALSCDRARRPYLCGLLVALALIKPTIAAPFAVALLVTARYRAVLAAAAYGAAATAVAWLVTNTSPILMLQQLAHGAAQFISDGTLGLVDLVTMLGASPAAVVWLPLLIALPGLALMAGVRPSLPIAFAVATVWARLWTYHKSYDDVMLVFVLVPLGVFALRQAPSRLAVVAFVVMGVLAWIPGQLLMRPEVQILQLAVWPSALAALVVLNRRYGAAAHRSAHAHLEHVHA
jgi:hypothetical protein